MCRIHERENRHEILKTKNPNNQEDINKHPYLTNFALHVKISA